jgi:hypothetical protein
MGRRTSAATIGSFAALGDSFTEGLNDRLPGGSFRGWADRFADMLSVYQPGTWLTAKSMETTLCTERTRGVARAASRR